jgi:hypothetical protein
MSEDMLISSINTFTTRFSAIMRVNETQHQKQVTVQNTRVTFVSTVVLMDRRGALIDLNFWDDKMEVASKRAEIFVEGQTFCFRDLRVLSVPPGRPKWSSHSGFSLGWQTVNGQGGSSFELATATEGLFAKESCQLC